MSFNIGNGLIPYKTTDPNQPFYYYRTPRTSSVSLTQSTSSTTTATTSTTSTTSTTTANSGVIEVGNSLSVATLEAGIISSDSIITSALTSNSINVATLSGFETGINDDVTFFGNNPGNKLFWDSSENTLYIDGTFKTSDSSITLNNDSNESTLTSSDGEDKGFFFKWYDGSQENIGFMGFDLSDQTFKIYSETTTSSGAITSGTIGNFLLNSLETQTIQNYDSNNLGININNGDFDMILTGDSTNQLNIHNNSSSVNISSDYNDSSAILIDATNGGINIDANDDINITSITGSFNVDINSSSNVLNFDDTNGLTVQNEKTDYKKWFPFNKFDIGITGIWESKMDVLKESFYWEKDQTEEISTLYLDITESIRDTTDKGLKINRIYFNYNISDDTLNAITVKVVKKSLSTSSSVFSTVTTSDGNLLASGLTIGEHYRYIDISIPEFLNDDNTYSVFIDFDCKSTTTIKFFGSMIYFSYNHL